jgi:hypothetical protein
MVNRLPRFIHKKFNQLSNYQIVKTDSAPHDQFTKLSLLTPVSQTWALLQELLHVCNLFPLWCSVTLIFMKHVSAVKEIIICIKYVFFSPSADHYSIPPTSVCSLMLIIIVRFHFRLAIIVLIITWLSSLSPPTQLSDTNLQLYFHPLTATPLIT